VGRDSLAVHKRRWEQINQLGGSFTRESLLMASSSKRKSKIADAINLLGDDGVIVSLNDYNKFEALVGD